jgi:hypothetical protein
VFSTNTGDKGIEPTLTSWGGGRVDKLGAKEATGKEALRTYPVAAKKESYLVSTLIENEYEQRMGKAEYHDIDLFQ